MHEFCWVDLSTFDKPTAARFYGQLFNWTAQEAVGAMGRDYTRLAYQGQFVGGLFSMPPEMRALRLPSHWTGYVRVPNVEATAGQVEDLGGSVVCVMEAGDGIMSIVRDHTGASFALWEGGTQRSAELREAPHSSCWQELITTDPTGAPEFYRRLFGWTARATQVGAMAYTMFEHEDKPVAGMLAMPLPGARSQWNHYFAVEDIDAAVAQVQSLGGQLAGGPFDLPGVGRTAVLQDTQGATFCVRAT